MAQARQLFGLQLELLVQEGSNDHLDTVEGRYWLQLEWRALAAASSRMRLVPCTSAGR